MQQAIGIIYQKDNNFRQLCILSLSLFTRWNEPRVLSFSTCLRGSIPLDRLVLRKEKNHCLARQFRTAEKSVDEEDGDKEIERKSGRKAVKDEIEIKWGEEIKR